MNPALHSRLAEGAVVVTPNRRLARFLHAQFDAAQAARGRPAWATPTVVPYSVWLQMLWSDAMASEAMPEPALLLTSAQSTILWRRIVDAEAASLLDTRGAAGLAADAWTLVHAWGAGGESWRAWSASFEASDDVSIFVRWAEQYASALRRAGACSIAQAPDRLAAIAAPIARSARSVILAGFIELTPQQERLCAALAAAGVDVRRVDTLIESPRPNISRACPGSRRDELAAALAWARMQVEQRSAGRVGVVVEDLALRRDEVVALAQDLLCPGAILPGASAGALPFEVSLGLPLASVALVATAFELIALVQSGLNASAAAVLLRSPYLPDAERAWARRADCERVWLRGGVHAVDIGDAIVALEPNSPELAIRWRRARAAWRNPGSASPREWVDAWRAWLGDAGWPGTRPLDSDEYQTREAWERALQQFASLGAVTPRLGGAQAIDALRALLRDTVFQPEGRAAPIQILGILEGSGLSFDALWVAGLSADRWPPAPAPNPLLPLAWQRERDVPRSSAKRELAFAATLTARFAQGAPEVVFSSASSADDHALSPSALIAHYAERREPATATPWWRGVAGSATLESVIDVRAPPPEPGSIVPGGSRSIATQSDCPFQAAARHRLGAEPWPAPLAGLSARERGILVHATLAALWNELRDRATLLAMDPPTLATRVADAIERGLAELPALRWGGLPPLIRDGERHRLSALLAAWLAVERRRPPFAVRDIEAKQLLMLSGITFSLRLDRVDELDGGGIAIIDYKTGRIDRPAQWFEERPRSPQLGMYALAERDAQPELPVRAVAYAQLCPGAVAPAGLAADAAVWPGLDAVDSVGLHRDWRALESWWSRHLGALAAELARGHAAVTPRKTPSPCKNCGLQPLCRIESVRRVQDEESADE